MVAVNWSEFEREWLEVIALACSEIQRNFPQEELYAGAFWLLHGDYTSLLVPAFALNSETHATLTVERGQEIDVRWDPPDWKWSVVDEAVERMRPLYEQFLQLDVSSAEFDELWESHTAMLARVCRSTTACARARSGKYADTSISPRFLVGIIDWAQGEDVPKLLRLSLSEEVLGENGALLLEAQRN